MKKILILFGFLAGITAAAQAQTSLADIDTTRYKLTALKDVDWASLINRDYVFFDGPVLDLSNIDKGSIIQVRCGFEGNAPELGITTPTPQWGRSQDLVLSTQEGSRIVSARAQGNCVTLIVLAGDIPGNFIESVSYGGRPITIRGRVTDDYIKPGLK